MCFVRKGVWGCQSAAWLSTAETEPCDGNLGHVCCPALPGLPVHLLMFTTWTSFLVRTPAPYPMSRRFNRNAYDDDELEDLAEMEVSYGYQQRDLTVI